MSKLGFHEMLSYGHKPWDEDYREQRDTLQRAFDEADADQAKYDSNSGSDSNSRASPDSYDAGARDSDYGKGGSYYSRDSYDASPASQSVESADHAEDAEDVAYNGAMYTEEEQYGSADEAEAEYDDGEDDGGYGDYDDDDGGYYDDDD